MTQHEKHLPRGPHQDRQPRQVVSSHADQQFRIAAQRRHKAPDQGHAQRHLRGRARPDKGPEVDGRAADARQEVAAAELCGGLQRASELLESPDTVLICPLSCGLPRTGACHGII